MRDTSGVGAFCVLTPLVFCVDDVTQMRKLKRGSWMLTARFRLKGLQSAVLRHASRDAKASEMTVFKKKKNGVPDRWLDYLAVGKRIPRTRFIAFKVPMKLSLNARVPKCDAFGPWDLLDALEREKQELGLIIDLTFTTRYYKLDHIPEAWSYIKIFTKGHHIPGDATILSFKRAVRWFLRDNADNDKLIGVHCTHGLNRTGYLVCRYLIDVDGLDPRDAVELFNASRGHRIERQNYLDDLLSGPKRSNKGLEEAEQEPLKGCAVDRPRPLPTDSEPPEERRPHGNDLCRHRAAHQWGLSTQSCPCPCPGLLPPPPLLPALPLPLYRMAPPRYQWSPAHPDTQRRKPQHLEGTSPRAPPPQSGGSSFHPKEERRRWGHSPAAPPPSLSKGFCSNDPSQGAKLGGSRKKPRHRQ